MSDKRLVLKHPMQPIADDGKGVIRFKENPIVRDMLDFATTKGFGLNQMHPACGHSAKTSEYTDEDRAQLAQLIGYSLSGYADLRSYVSDAAYEAAELKSKAQEMTDDQLRVVVLESKLADVRRMLARGLGRLYDKHPDDFEDRS